MDAAFDQRLANEANAIDQCMKFGAVILKPQSQSSIGFSAPQPPIDPNKVARAVSMQRRTT